jgi:hypothetical protein
MADRNKNRIVINLDQPGGAPRTTPLRSGSSGQPRRWPRILGILAAFCIAVVLVAAIAVFLWWRHYQTTPAYSLALAIDAAQRNDIPAFRGRLDEQQIAKNLSAKVREKATNRYGVTMSDSLQRTIDNLLVASLPQLTDQIHQEIAADVKELSSRVEQKPFILVALGVSSLATIITEGDSARALAPVRDRTIEVAMRRDGDRWKIVDVKDDILVQRVVDSLMRDLPAIGTLDMKIPLVKPKPRRRNR